MKDTSNTAQDQLKNQNHNNKKVIVAIGSSAGGLVALEQFFQAIPSETGCVFVVISHIGAKNESFLAEILQRSTSMVCRQAEHKMQLEANAVYIIPPNQYISIEQQHFTLKTMPKKRGALPFNYFLKSLAKINNVMPICVILSGNGADGSDELDSIKSANGFILAEDPLIAEYGSMPSNAIATGLVDAVLSPIDISKKIMSLLEDSHRTTHSHLLDMNQTFSHELLTEIFNIIQPLIQHDFSQYKVSTICRRICKRMQAHKIERIADYICILKKEPSEANTLFKEFLIGVTSFFRDTEAFIILKKRLHNFIATKPSGYNFRVWVAGCSTGEEAYSIAILFQECIDSKKQHSIQIFGTDIDQEAINTARTGTYSVENIQYLEEERRNRYFIKGKDGRYSITPLIRDMVVFASHSIIKDPPFTKIDLLSCRNVLIYFSVKLQKKLLPIFNFSLKQNGILFLGPSESLGAAADAFSTINRKWKIFEKTSSYRQPEQLYLPLFKHGQILPTTNNKNQSVNPQSSNDSVSFNIVESILYQSDLPPCLVIDSDSNIIYIYGDINMFIEPPQGIISTNIYKMARSCIRDELHKLLQHSRRSQVKSISPDIIIHDNGETKNIQITVTPLQSHGFLNKYKLISFKEKTLKKDIAKDILIASTTNQLEDNVSTSSLQSQLKNAHFILKSTNDELEISNEELKSANEELQSTNEELQSTNEEMESSKEELQSLNEETSTVNVELQRRIDELNHASDDMKNLMDSVNVAAIFLDANANIRRFTKNIVQIVPLTSHDIGRPIGNFTTTLKHINLDTLSYNVMHNLKSYESEVISSDNEIYGINIRPYRTAHNVINGTVLTFENRTVASKTLQELQQNNRILTAMLNAMQGVAFAINTEGDITYFNRQCQLISGYTAEEVIGKSYIDLMIFIPHEKEMIRTLLTVKNELSPHKNLASLSWRCKDGSTVVIEWSYSFISNALNTDIETIIFNGNIVN